MDTIFTRKLINLSLKAAEESKDPEVKDIFLSQASRLDSELNQSLKENEPCTDAHDVRKSQAQVKSRTRRSSRSVKSRTKTSSEDTRKPSRSRARAQKRSKK